MRVLFGVDFVGTGCFVLSRFVVSLFTGSLILSFRAMFG